MIFMILREIQEKYNKTHFFTYSAKILDFFVVELTALKKLCVHIILLQ